MSDIKETIYYKELRAGDLVQDGDQFRDVDGQWKPYTFLAHMGGKVELGETARRPIRTTHQTTYEEVPGTRTLQQAVEQPQRERWAYEELRPGDMVQEGDQWLNPDGRWQAIVLTPEASMEVGEVLRVRRPYKISTLLEIGDALAALKSAQRARDELQLQVDELRADRRDEPTARQVQEMLRTWATELDWSGCCFDSVGRDKVSAVQRVLVSVIERIGSMIDPEDTSADT